MHVAPDGLKTVRQDGITVGFAMLGPMAYILAEVPRTGSSGTSLERPCDRAHWGFVIDGEMTFVSGRRRQAIPSGRAFHVPAGGPMHRFETAGRLVLAAFQPVEAGAGRQRRAAHRAGLRGPDGVQPADRRPGRLSRPRRARRDQGRDVADVPVRHDPGPDGRTERVHLGLVRRTALGARHPRSPGHRMGERRRDPLERRHLPLPGRTAGPSHRGGRPGHVPRPHARRRVRVRGTNRRLAARDAAPTGTRTRGIAVAALG